MTLIPTKQLLLECDRGGYAVGAFNINGLDQPRAMINRAEQIRSPIIVVFPGFAEKYIRLDDFSALITSIAQNSSVPVSSHLSHASDFSQFERACRLGFKSAMFDGSSLSYEENIYMTSEAVKLGHHFSCDVEGELGTISSSWVDIHESMTDPDLAEEFVKRTKVDILAVAIGNSHGLYKGKPCLDFTRLAAIKKAIEPHRIFLTLHGGSGIPPDDIRQSIKLGISKICIYTEMCIEGKTRVVNYTDKHPGYYGNQDVPDMMGALLRGFIDVMERYMQLFMSIGKS